ncbi:D-lyxose/D-mannose family sugar isomerase [Edaphovirga cremea]|uniref:D-lyxose/D-mannose isomerase n=1 Tax=Edaphovirga cremea TaxID=2267246 RepID=UPI000DEF648E|nr:D-lyxose/D-mannose family sugar isomerase [Edaphovirga cremea]
MDRSQVNRILQETQQFFVRQDVHLPPFAHFSPQSWQLQTRENWQEVFDLKLGWDVTSFGSDDFRHHGLTLFTLRNGSVDGKRYSKSYAEKVMHCREGQVTPMHFHWRKMEDIINRGGGNLIVELHNQQQQQLASTPVSVAIDGFRQTHAAGSRIRLSPGESVTLTPGLFHSFWGEEGYGDVLVGEVSMTNDDEHDNYFLTPLARFDPIRDDEAPRWLLCNEYARYLSSS